MSAAVERIRRAILDEGPHPNHHREVMERHRAEWPTLWAAIDALLADDGSGVVTIGELIVTTKGSLDLEEFDAAIRKWIDREGDR